MENATLNPEEELQKFRVLIGDAPEQSTQPVNRPPPVTASGVVDADVEMQKFRALTAEMPMSQNAVNQVRGVSVQSGLSMAEREGRKDAAGELIPISNEGIGAKYFRAALQRGPDAQLAVIQKMYPGKNARILESGSVVVEITDSQTGKPKDVIINPEGLEAHDLMDLAVQLPEIAAGVAVGLMTSGIGFLKTTAQIVFSALAGAGTGTVRDVVARGAEGIPVNFGEIAKSRGGDAALDMFLSTAMLGAAKSTRALSPFSKELKPDTMEFDLLAAQKFFKREFGETFPLTPAEITGSPALRAVEATETPQPGARTVMTRLREKSQQVVRRIQDRAVGKVTSDEAIGSEALTILREKVAMPLETALNTARATAEAKGQQGVLDLIDDAIGMPRGARITPSQAGDATLAAFEARRAQAQTLVDDAYAKVNELPGGSGDVLGGSPAARAAAEIRKELPAVLKTKMEETGLVDEFGKPMKREVQKREVLGSGVPEGLAKALSDLESLSGGKVSLQTLTNMKRAAYDEIAKTEAVPGVKERWFNKIAGAYEKGIQEGIDETGDPTLKAALTNAKETYKKELLPFDRPGVKEMAKGEFDAAQLSSEQITNRLFEGPKAIKNYEMLKETLGANNPAFRILKRAWADTQIADVTDPITGAINAQSLANKFHQLNVDRPELAREMFGSTFPRLVGDLRTLAAFRTLKTIDETEVRALMSMPSPTKTDLLNVIKMQKNRDEVYANRIIAESADGLPLSPGLKPTEFVKRITNANTPTADVEKVLDVIAKESPETRDAIATATMYRLLDEATVHGAETATKSIGGGALNISPTKLAQAIGRKGTPERTRIEVLLGGEDLPIVPGQKGPTRIDVLENLVDLLAPGEVRSKAMGAAGSLGAGMAIRQLMTNPFKYAKSYTQKMALSLLYTSELGTKLVANRAFGPAETAALANTLIASEPFTRRLMETVGDESVAASVIGELKDSIDRFVSELAESPQARDQAELAKFARGQPAKVSVPR